MKKKSFGGLKRVGAWYCFCKIIKKKEGTSLRRVRKKKGEFEKDAAAAAGVVDLYKVTR